MSDVRHEAGTSDPGQAEAAREESFAELLAREEAKPQLEIGQIVRGRIVQIGGEEVFVDVDGTGEAVVSRVELMDADGNLEVAVGDTVEATVVALQPDLRLSRKLARGEQARQQLAAAFESGLPVEGRVAGVIKGGYEVTIAGMRAFCPFSQIDDHRVDDHAEHLNQVFEFRILELSPDGRKFVVSRRKLLEAEAKRRAEETRASLTPGAVVEGRVTTLMPFGAFVDVGGIQGLVHISELSHRRVDDPAEVVAPGQHVRVQVLKIAGDAGPEGRVGTGGQGGQRSREGKLSLSMKALEADPWSMIGDRIRPRQVIAGRALRAADFGLFVELLPGVEGLVPQGELPRGSTAAIKDWARERRIVSVIVLEADPARRRVSLALAPEGMAPGETAAAAELRVGAVVEGEVEEVKPFGVMLRLAPGQVGLVPNSEMGTPRGTDHAREFPVGSKLTAEVIGLEARGRKIRLSRAQAIRREERAEIEAHGKPQLEGALSTFGDLLRQAQTKKRR